MIGGGIIGNARIISLMGAAMALPLALAGEGVLEVEGYHGEPYRSPVPDTLEGAEVVSTEIAHALWLAGGTGFIDVLPRAPKPENLPEGTIWREKPRASIPGAIWLVNTGYQQLAEETLAYFKYGLSEASGGDKSAPLVFFCLADCWMSWNAAKRAMALGYERVYWYPEGTDGWGLMDYPLEEITPFLAGGSDGADGSSGDGGDDGPDGDGS